MEDKTYLTEQEIMVALLSGNGLGDEHSYVRLDDIACFLRVWDDGTEEAFPSALVFDGMWTNVYYINKEFDDRLSPKEFMLHLGGGGKAIKEDWDDRYLALDEEGNMNIYGLDGSILEGFLSDRLISLSDWYRLKIDASQIAC